MPSRMYAEIQEVKAESAMGPLDTNRDFRLVGGVCIYSGVSFALLSGAPKLALSLWSLKGVIGTDSRGC